MRQTVAPVVHETKRALTLGLSRAHAQSYITTVAPRARACGDGSGCAIYIGTCSQN